MRKPLNEKKKAFLDGFIETGSATKAARAAGYNNPAQRGMQLRDELADEIRKRVHRRIDALAPMCLGVLVEIASDPESQQAVRVKAVESLLSRAGYDATQKIEQTNINDTRTDAELQQVLAGFIGRMNAEQVPAELTSFTHTHTHPQKVKQQANSLAAH